MHFVDTVRRLAAPAAGLVGAAAVCIACSSSTVGAPAPSGPGGVSLGSLPGTPSISVPGVSSLPSLTGIPSLSGLPSIGGDQSGSAFCKDFSSADLSSLGSSSDASHAVALWDKLAADAPDEVKDDVQAVDDYLHKAVAGDINGLNAQKLSSAAQHIGTYFAGHCAG
jgi:hypothetical protein